MTWNFLCRVPLTAPLEHKRFVTGNILCRLPALHSKMWHCAMKDQDRQSSTCHVGIYMKVHVYSTPEKEKGKKEKGKGEKKEP